MTNFFTKLASGLTALALVASFVPSAALAQDGVEIAVDDTTPVVVTEEIGAEGEEDVSSDIISNPVLTVPGEETGDVSEGDNIFDQVVDMVVSTFSVEDDSFELMAGTMYVDASAPSNGDGSESAPFNSIQSAITAAVPGDVINVAAGTYIEAVNVDKSLSLIGAGKGQTIIAPATVASTGVGHKYTSNMKTSLFVNNVTNVVIDGFTIKDDGQTPGATGADAVVFWNDATGTIRNSAVDGDYAINGNQTGQGIAVDASMGKTTTLRVENTDISGFQKNALDIVNGNSLTSNGGDITVEVVGGSITGAGPTGLIAQNGLVTWDRAGGSVVATVDGTAISSIEYTGSSASASGILAYGTSRVSSVANTSFTNVQDYINVAPGGAAIDATDGNTFDGVSVETATGAQLGAIEDRMETTSDNAANSAVFLRSETYIVTSNTLGLQAVINAVPAGSIVLVAPGTYAESVTIAKELSLYATAGSKPMLTGTAGSNAVIKVTADNVIIDGFAIAASTSIENGIDISGSSNVTVLNSEISSFGKRGIRFTNSNGSIHDSEIIGDNVDGIGRVQNLVNVWGGSNVEIYNNELHNALTTGTTPTWSSVAIFVSSFGGSGASTADIHDNEIYASDTGVTVGSVYANAGDASVATITGNVFRDLVSGVIFEQGTASATINENSFSGTVAALAAYSDENGTSTPAVNADRNWWGSNADPKTTGQAYTEAVVSNWYVDAEMTTLNTEETRSGNRSGGSRRTTTTANTGGEVAGASTGGEVLGASTFNFTMDLTIGSTGAEVTALQAMLIASGDLVIAAPTGYFGEMTRAALAKWQAAHGVMPASGYFGPITRAAVVAAGTPAPTMSAEARAALIKDLLEKVKALQDKIAEMEEDEA